MKRALLVAVGWGLVGAVIWLSVTPAPPQIDMDQGDKLGHFAAYGTLMLWFALLYPKLAVRVAYAAGFIALGIGLEFVQRALGYRSFEILDMVADGIGVLLGWAGALAVPRILAR